MSSGPHAPHVRRQAKSTWKWRGFIRGNQLKKLPKEEEEELVHLHGVGASSKQDCCGLWLWPARAEQGGPRGILAIARTYGIVQQ